MKKDKATKMFDDDAMVVKTTVPLARVSSSSSNLLERMKKLVEEQDARLEEEKKIMDEKLAECRVEDARLEAEQKLLDSRLENAGVPKDFITDSPEYRRLMSRSSRDGRQGKVAENGRPPMPNKSRPPKPTTTGSQASCEEETRDQPPTTTKSLVSTASTDSASRGILKSKKKLMPRFLVSPKSNEEQRDGPPDSPGSSHDGSRNGTKRISFLHMPKLTTDSTKDSKKSSWFKPKPKFQKRDPPPPTASPSQATEDSVEISVGNQKGLSSQKKAQELSTTLEEEVVQKKKERTAPEEAVEKKKKSSGTVHKKERQVPSNVVVEKNNGTLHRPEKVVEKKKISGAVHKKERQPSSHKAKPAQKNSGKTSKVKENKAPPVGAISTTAPDVSEPSATSPPVTQKVSDPHAEEYNRRKALAAEKDAAMNQDQSLLRLKALAEQEMQHRTQSRETQQSQTSYISSMIPPGVPPGLTPVMPPGLRSPDVSNDGAGFGPSAFLKEVIGGNFFEDVVSFWKTENPRAPLHVSDAERVLDSLHIDCKAKGTEETVEEAIRNIENARSVHCSNPKIAFSRSETIQTGTTAGGGDPSWDALSSYALTQTTMSSFGHTTTTATEPHFIKDDTLHLTRVEGRGWEEEAIHNIVQARKNRAITKINLCHPSLFSHASILTAVVNTVAATFDERSWDSITFAQTVTASDVASLSKDLIAKSIDQSNRLRQFRQLLSSQLEDMDPERLEMEAKIAFSTPSGTQTPMICAIQGDILSLRPEA